MTAMRFLVVLMLCLGSPLTSAWATTPADAAAPTKPSVQKKAAGKAAVHAAPASHKATAASKTKARKEADAIAAPVPKAKLDLTLPKDMVSDLHAPGTVAPTVKPTAKPIQDGYLPPLFPDKKSGDFQLNGRLLSNEMQLQLRNEDAHKVEGAALDFEFKQ